MGSQVLYVLSEEDAIQINRRRTSGPSIAERIKEKLWPCGAQAHIGSPVKAGDIFPALVIRTWGFEEFPLANLQVFLDGCDVFWAMEVAGSPEPFAKGKYFFDFL